MMKAGEPRAGWSDERRERAAALWKEGYSAREIAGMIKGPGFTPSRNSVIGIMHRAGLSGSKGEPKSTRQPSKPKLPKRVLAKSTVWSDDEKNILSRGFDHGHSAAQIAKTLKVAGYDRQADAIASKLRHMGLTRSSVERNETARLAISLLRGPIIPATPPPPPAQLSAGEGVSLLALDKGMCKSPMGERDGEAVFCGLPVAGFRKPYCSGCSNTSKVPRTLGRISEPYDIHNVRRSYLPKVGFQNVA
ncbi:GcrA family cell cycle regulator [Asticcacaulis excentricus]|uniref:GcrA cell cycle regulator n=1 Tax=Asticcacaulis excentricus (strain ATCC 15261 / DSM 4724 / KCTC 12464 / NCIMB 9791 / VKM B-1370 / CB 48) TaxID=573065 RepID=E8RPP1_ASTEC|nr:GcrA cell cycle regulator [Asticcacaulis excentricus]ADU12018.1 GcrA cell cycle regulator [Asticcacaulis excentricus CB 48]